MKMKRYIALLLALLLAVSICSCSKKEESGLPDGMLLLDNGAIEYNFYYPDSWSVDRNDGMVSVYVSEKDRSNVSVVTFTANNDVYSVDDYLTMGDTTYFAHLESTFPDLEIITDGEETSLDSIPARQYVYTATVAGDAYKFRQIFTYRYGEIYIITYTSTLDGFDTHTDDVNRIISEFSFK